MTQATTNTAAETITIQYSASVFTPAGWRGVTITATAKKTSAKMAEVLEVVEIDGEAVTRNMSRTGARRQEYNGASVAIREEGKKKRLSACKVL